MKNKKNSNRKNIEELRRLKLFGDSEKDSSNEDFESINGGKKDTTVDTHWPTKTNNGSNE